jgi:SHAQKYF class myb-like DNA-binding protein
MSHRLREEPPLRTSVIARGFKRNDEPRPGGGGAESKVGTDTSSAMRKRRRDCSDADMWKSQSKISKYEGCTGYLKEENTDYPPEEDKSQSEEEEMIIRENSGGTAKAVEETITESCSASDESERNGKFDEHQAFVAAVFEIGLVNSSPSVIMENMINLPPHITRERTKSHLQKFRKAKDESKENFLKEYDEFFKTAEETKAATISKGAVAPREDAILFSVLDGRNSNELVGGDAAAILSYSIINNCQHTPDPTKLPFRGVSASFPTLTKTEKDSELGASLIFVKGLLSHMTEHLLTTRLCQHRRKKNHLSSSSLSKTTVKQSTPNNSVRHDDTGSSGGGGRQDSCRCSDKESDEEAEDQRSRLIVSVDPQNQKVIASGVGSPSSSLKHRPVGQQQFNSTMQHGYCCYDPPYSSAGQVDPTLRQTHVAPNSCWSHGDRHGLNHPILNNQQHHAPYLQQHISSHRKYPQMHPTNNNWHLSSHYTHAEKGWHQKYPPFGVHPHNHQPYAHHNRSSTRLPPPQRPPPRPPLQHPPYPPPRYNVDAPLHNLYPCQGIHSSLTFKDVDHTPDRVRSREKEEVHQISRPRCNLALPFNFGGNRRPETPEDISSIGKRSDQDHMWDLIPGKRPDTPEDISPIGKPSDQGHTWDFIPGKNADDSTSSIPTQPRRIPPSV